MIYPMPRDTARVDDFPLPMWERLSHMPLTLVLAIPFSQILEGDIINKRCPRPGEEKGLGRWWGGWVRTQAGSPALWGWEAEARRLLRSGTGRWHIPRAFRSATLLTPDESHVRCQPPNCKMVNLYGLMSLGLWVSCSHRLSTQAFFRPVFVTLFCKLMLDLPTFFWEGPGGLALYPQGPHPDWCLTYIAEADPTGP